jgi:uncharacterized protein YktA (UPF0223 family)
MKIDIDYLIQKFESIVSEQEEKIEKAKNKGVKTIYFEQKYQVYQEVVLALMVEKQILINAADPLTCELLKK